MPDNTLTAPRHASPTAERPRGSAVSVALGPAIAGLIGFGALLWLVQGGHARGLDGAVLRALRSPGDPADPVGPAWLEITMRDVTALGGHPLIVLAAAVALGYLALARRWASAVLLAGSLAGAFALNMVLKRVLDRPRPDLVAHLVEVQTASFPSSHAMLSAVAFLTMGAILAGGAERGARDRGYVMGVAAALTLLVGFSRVYLGVHWPTDVLAGWCLGAAWAAGCWLALRRLVPHGRHGEA